MGMGGPEGPGQSDFSRGGAPAITSLVIGPSHLPLGSWSVGLPWPSSLQPQPALLVGFISCF